MVHHGRKKKLPRIAILAAIVLPIGLVLARPYIWPAFPLKDVVAYESLFEWGQVGEVPEGEVPYRTGKVITVRPSSWQVYRFGAQMLTQISPDCQHRKEHVIDPARVDDSWYSLPGSIRASSPDEVGTVIICDYRMTTVKEYHGTADFYGPEKAYRRVVWLKTYDLRSRRFIGECALAEPHPDITFPLAGSYTGDPDEIAAFIAEKMPLREGAGDRQ